MLPIVQDFKELLTQLFVLTLPDVLLFLVARREDAHNLRGGAFENLAILDSLVTLTDGMREESATADGILGVGETWTYTYSYEVTEADIEAGKVLNKVTAIDPQDPQNPSTDEVNVPLKPADPTEPTEPTKPSEPTEHYVAKTGENQSLYPWIGMVLMTVGAAFIVLRRKLRGMTE